MYLYGGLTRPPCTQAKKRKARNMAGERVGRGVAGKYKIRPHLCNLLSG